ncbi:hypothetical protein P4530_02440, partial [Bacillus thuringiensis]|nr:hypothetical protein [Bacillus thuringiensis]
VTLVLKKVEKAIKSQQKAEIILHSDQGSIYTSYAFQTLSKENVALPQACPVKETVMIMP